MYPARCPERLSGPPGAQSPFAYVGYYPKQGDVWHHLRRHYPSFIAPTGSCARPNPSPRRRFLMQGVFAGCCQPLLGFGPSRRYLCNPCVGAWTLRWWPLPRRSLPVLLPVSSRQTSASRYPQRVRLAKWPCIATSAGGKISRLQSFTNVQAPTLARPPGCSHTCVRRRR